MQMDAGKPQSIINAREIVARGLHEMRLTLWGLINISATAAAPLGLLEFAKPVQLEYQIKMDAVGTMLVTGIFTPSARPR